MCKNDAFCVKVVNDATITTLKQKDQITKFTTSATKFTTLPIPSQIYKPTIFQLHITDLYTNDNPFCESKHIERFHPYHGSKQFSPKSAFTSLFASAVFLSHDTLSESVMTYLLTNSSSDITGLSDTSKVALPSPPTRSPVGEAPPSPPVTPPVGEAPPSLLVTHPVRKKTPSGAAFTAGYAFGRGGTTFTPGYASSRGGAAFTPSYASGQGRDAYASSGFAYVGPTDV